MDGARFSPEQLAAASGGSWLSKPPEGTLSLISDTRQDGRGAIFIPLTGEKFDAHNFLDKAVDAGCPALCVKKDKLHLAPPGIPVLAVNDPLLAMQQIATAHRNSFADLQVAAVTGSVGKTSVKEMIRAIFTASAGADHVLYTIGNTNNHIGVPQNLLRLTANHRYAVIEMGTSSPGEIAPLAAMASPNAAVVNSIAPCHLEKLLSLEGVAREKGTAFTRLKPGGCAILPADSPANEILHQAAAGHRKLTFGSNGRGDISTRQIDGDMLKSSFVLSFPDRQEFTISWNLSGSHQILNAAAAAAAAYAMDIAPETIAAGLTATTLPGMRMLHREIDGVNYINDAYNANPASMAALIELIRSTTDDSRVVLVLGGMKELGENSAPEHRKVLNFAAAALPRSRIITVGPEFAGLPGAVHFTASGDGADYLQKIIRRGDIVVAKGSRSTATELILPPEAR